MPRVTHRHVLHVTPFIDLGHGRLEALRTCNACGSIVADRLRSRPRFKLLRRGRV